MAARNFYDPEAQRQILHIYTEANSDDPNLAELLVPINSEQQKGASRSAHDANLAMGTLMLGLPVVLVQGGIHAGEIDGKDAGFLALRELLDGTRIFKWDWENDFTKRNL